MKRSKLKLLRHHCSMSIFGISTPITTDGWTDATAKKSNISQGRIYLVVSSEEFSFLLVPGGSIPWVQEEGNWDLVGGILSLAQEELSRNRVPKVTYFSGFQGPSESDQVNFLTSEFWDRIRNFVGMALKSLNREG